jgi:hypothetical protein
MARLLVLWLMALLALGIVVLIIMGGYFAKSAPLAAMGAFFGAGLLALALGLTVGLYALAQGPDDPAAERPLGGLLPKLRRKQKAGVATPDSGGESSSSS